MRHIEGNKGQEATVVEKDTVQDVQLWSVLRKDSYCREIYELRRASACAKDIKFFSQLQESVVIALLRNGTLLNSDTDIYIFHQGNLYRDIRRLKNPSLRILIIFYSLQYNVYIGDPSRSFFILLKGSVSVLIETKDDEGEIIYSTCVKKLYRGDAFGEPVKMEAARFRSASVVSNEETKVCSILFELIKIIIRCVL